MPRNLALVAIIILALGGLFFASVSVDASTALQATATIVSQSTPIFDTTRLAQPSTVYPPAQADNGAQTYWGMCMECHGDRGQGLTEEWRNSFALDQRDCWKSGCHGSDYPENSFEIPTAGAPALAGAGKLPRFSNAFELHNHIQKNMPFFPPGSLTPDEAWSLTAYVMRLNDRQLAGFTLNGINGSAIPVHREVSLPENEIPGSLILVGVLILAVIGLNLQVHRNQAGSITPARKPNFLHHLHPPSIPAEQARFRYTLGAGGLAVFLSLILLITGLLEMYYYIPTPGQAAISVETIVTLVPFGNLIRNLHYWSAQFLVIVMTVHLLRVALTGAYAPPRRFNHLLGLGLLVFILLLDFTGYVLRWDEGIRWALVVGANLIKTIPWIGDGVYQFAIGGSEPGTATLTRFYTWHIFGLTLGAAILIIWHAFRVRRDGGIAVPPPSERREKHRITRFELLSREVLAMVIAGVVLLLFSVIVPAPIGQPISDSGTLTSDSRAPWFFLWVQQLLKLGDPFLLGVLTPVLVVIALGLMPYVLPNAKSEELGRWFTRGNRVAQVLTVLIILVILVLTVIGAMEG
ncbi:MAG: cytochrome b N-terminal domain-containing protein [Anaerolineales bacterium]|nr:cytochrome b N-terminal domain-containing protein [Anaerolineales bacterium]